MTTSAACWLLDVDGVIRARWPRWDTKITVDVLGTTTTYSPNLVRWIRDIAEIADLTWCTSWCGCPDSLQALADALNLQLPLAFGGRLPSQTWADLKVRAVREALATGRQVIWTDDAEVPAALRMFPEIRNAQRDGQLLTIAPDPFNGLTFDDMSVIERFALQALRVPARA